MESVTATAASASAREKTPASRPIRSGNFMLKLRDFLFITICPFY
jgi:hypothetical protein